MIRVNSPDVAALGPYSHAVILTGTPVILSGLIATGEDGAFVGGTFEEQTNRTLRNAGLILEAVIRQANPAWHPKDKRDPFKIVAGATIYLADTNDFPAFNKLYAECFYEGEYPARATIGARPPVDDAFVEVALLAELPISVNRTALERGVPQPIDL